MSSLTMTAKKAIHNHQNLDPEKLFTGLEEIGRGCFGAVFKAFDVKAKRVVAIKIIDLEDTEEIEDIQQEIMVLAECNSPYVTKYYGSFLKDSHLWISMEYMGVGSAAELLNSGPLEEAHISVILREVLRGLMYLHSLQKIHRDIKGSIMVKTMSHNSDNVSILAANILLSENFEVKLADFGVVGQLSETVSKRNTLVGTPFWMAPEIIKQRPYDVKVDIWSLGITAIELAKGEPPHADELTMRVLFIIAESPPPRLDGGYSRMLKDFVEVCLNKEQRNRPSARVLLQHPFIKKAKKNSILRDVIARHKDWKAYMAARKTPSEETEGEIEDEDDRPIKKWNYATLNQKLTDNEDFLKFYCSFDENTYICECKGDKESAISPEAPNFPVTPLAAASQNFDYDAKKRNSTEAAHHCPEHGQTATIDKIINNEFLILLVNYVNNEQWERYLSKESSNKLRLELFKTEKMHPGFCEDFVNEVIHILTKQSGQNDVD